MTLLTKSTTIVFRLKINFIVIATTIINIVATIIVDIVTTTIVDIVVNKLNFVMTNMCFIFVAIDTRYITLKFEKTLKTKNKRSIESLNENYIHRKLDSYKIVKN